MTIQPKPCAYCGEPLTPGARFCGSCGRPVPAPAAEPAATPSPAGWQAPAPAIVPTPAPMPQPAPGANADVVLGVLPALQQRKGMFGHQLFVPVITSHRLVFALITSEMQKQAAEAARQGARQQGKGFLSQWGAMITAGISYGEPYLSKPVNAILAEHSENFYLMHDQVQQVRLISSDPDEPNDRDQVEFHTPNGKQRFTLGYGSLGEVRNALQPIYGKRVK